MVRVEMSVKWRGKNGNASPKMPTVIDSIMA